MSPFFRIIISILLVSLLVALSREAGILPSFGFVRTRNSQAGILPPFGFVRTRNSHQFVLDVSPFFFNGFNSYWVMNAAPVPCHKRQATDFFERAAAAGHSVCRTWAFSDAGTQQALQISSRLYTEYILRGLDFIISESRKNGIRLILSLGNNIYKDFGGRRWGGRPGDDLYYTNEVDKGYFKQQVERLLTRINTITGVAYKDDPTIVAWELISQVDHLSGETLNGWIQEMGRFIKTIDSNHLLTVGVEGFYGDPNMPQQKAMNPACQVGTDFVSNHLFKEIDFTIIYANPNIWLMKSRKGNSQGVHGKDDFAHILHLAAQSNSDGFVNLLDIANAANPLWASSSSISGFVTKNPISKLHRISRIHPKDDRTVMARELTSRPRRHCQVYRTAPLNKRIQERVSFVKSVASKQVTTVGVEEFHGDPNITEQEAINELGKGDGEGMNVEKEKYYKQFPDMHRLGRRLLQHKGSSPTPRLVAVSRASGPITPSGPSPCTHIPIGDGHC